MYNKARKKWFIQGNKLECNIREYDVHEKKNNEKNMSNFIKKIEKHMKKRPIDTSKQALWEEEIISIIKSFIKNDEIFNLSGLDTYELDCMINMNREFLYRAREFDSKIEKDSVFQALRNVWIVGILQDLLGEKICLKKSIFAYSMVYPYSDNFLDDNNITNEEKDEFNEKLYLMVKGEKIHLENELEEKIYKLINYIEDDYERSKYQGVYRSLIDIYKSQVKSIKQQGKMYIPYEADILDISIEKGGTSVLVDGYLIKGDLNDLEKEFCINYGTLLQLIDDFQDLKEDNYSTIMTQVAEKYYLDVIINKLINYVYDLFNNTRFLENRENLKKVMISNCIIMIVCNIALNKQYFSENYIKDMEKYIPFTIDYIEVLDKDLKKKLRKTEGLA